MAKRLGELQDLSCVVLFPSSDACLSYFPEYVAKTESALKYLPRSFVINSLNDFAAVLDEELLLCCVRPLREYLKRTSSFVDRSRHLFLSPRSPSRAMSKNRIYYLLLEVIFESRACKEDGAALRAHSLFRQNTYLQNKKHTLTCQGGTGCYRFNYQPGS